MKIDDNSIYSSLFQGTAASQATLADRSDSTSERTTISPRRSDSVTLSGAARLVGHSSGTSKANVTFDAHRVAELKYAVHTGGYAINPDQVAEKLHKFSMSLQ